MDKCHACGKVVVDGRFNAHKRVCGAYATRPQLKCYDCGMMVDSLRDHRPQCTKVRPETPVAETPQAAVRYNEPQLAIECPVCMSPAFVRDCVRMPCNHMVCCECKKQLQRPICPVCRAPFA